MRCGTCHHFDRYEAGGEVGSCIAHPPVASIIMVPAQGGQGFRPENFTAFPSLQSSQTCGEWEKAHPRLILPH